MVQVSKMLLGLATILMASTIPTNIAEQVPAFEVPNFDYGTLSTGSTPADLLAALKKDGIVSFTNVPSYTQVRQAYLDSAASCAVSAQKVNAGFLLHKTLTDGTNRYTISTPSGQEANPNATTTDATCPGYQAVYTEFSSVLERVVLSVATTLDATSFTTKDGYGQTISSRKLMTDAVRLDHFHAYESPSQHERRLVSTLSSSDNDLSLELHEDDGMFIVFATPAFYKVDSGNTGKKLESVSVGGEDESESGLIIQTHDGQRVRPVLKPDQVTIMVGTGYNRWVATSEQLPAVMHGMRMPKAETTDKQRLLRAWFGKMTLLPSYQRMLKQMDFDVHANTTVQYLQQGHESDRQLLGCAPGRRLMASADAECSFKECSVKAGASAPSEGCSVVCNRNHDTDAGECSSSCTCTTSSHSATTCWMLCVKDLDTCDLSAQTCSGQVKACKPNAAPTPTTPAPTPTTPAPTSAPTPTTPAPTPAPTPTTPAPTSGPTPTIPAPTSGPSPTTAAPTPSSDSSTTTAPVTDTTTTAPSTETDASEERDLPSASPVTTAPTSSPTSSTSGPSDSSTPETTSPHGVC